jgi:hypothetical protein
MKLVKESIAFQKKKDPKDALFGMRPIPGKIYAWYFFKEDNPIFMMFIKYNESDSYPFYVCEFARLNQEQVVLQFPEYNSIVKDSLEPLTEKQEYLMHRKLSKLDDEEKEILKAIQEETKLVPYV